MLVVCSKHFYDTIFLKIRCINNSVDDGLFVLLSYHTFTSRQNQGVSLATLYGHFINLNNTSRGNNNFIGSTVGATCVQVH